MCDAGFSSYTSAKTTDSNRLNTETDKRNQLFSLNPDLEICKNVKQCYLAY